MIRPLFLAALSLLLSSSLHAAFQLTSPLEHQVIQRSAKNRGILPIAGRGIAPGADLEARVVGAARADGWRRLDARFDVDNFQATLEVPAGGWFRLEVRATIPGKEPVISAIAQVGVGEVFVVAGQSNSANHGEEKLETSTGRVASFDGANWKPCKDPQPGASGDGGSFMPPLGDELVERLGVPIGFIACGIGATSVREWLPAGTSFPHPPSLEHRVRRRVDGSWESKGEAFAILVDRMKSTGTAGFRAVLWHQGESDANQADASRTLPGERYRDHLERLIHESSQASGRRVPWMVAQVSYHGPTDPGSAEIRAAQASLWQDGIALSGPDSDALRGDLRDQGGKGIHFSGMGQRALAAAWADKIVPWLRQTGS